VRFCTMTRIQESSGQTLHFEKMGKVGTVDGTVDTFELSLCQLVNYRGHVVAYLDEALCYKLEGRGFDSGEGNWIFEST
jgi:hypothetical protein